MSKKKRELYSLRIGDSFQVQKNGRAYTIHDVVISNPNFDHERDAVFGNGYNFGNQYYICVGPRGLTTYEPDKKVILLNRGPAWEDYDE